MFDLVKNTSKLVLVKTKSWSYSIDIDNDIYFVQKYLNNRDWLTLLKWMNFSNYSKELVQNILDEFMKLWIFEKWDDEFKLRLKTNKLKEFINLKLKWTRITSQDDTVDLSWIDEVDNWLDLNLDLDNWDLDLFHANSSNLEKVKKKIENIEFLKETEWINKYKLDFLQYLTFKLLHEFNRNFKFERLYEKEIKDKWNFLVHALVLDYSTNFFTRSKYDKISVIEEHKNEDENFFTSLIINIKTNFHELWLEENSIYNIEKRVNKEVVRKLLDDEFKDFVIEDFQIKTINNSNEIRIFLWKISVKVWENNIMSKINKLYDSVLKWKNWESEELIKDILTSSWQDLENLTKVFDLNWWQSKEHDFSIDEHFSDLYYELKEKYLLTDQIDDFLIKLVKYVWIFSY